MLVYDIYLTLVFGCASFARWLSQRRPVPVRSGDTFKVTSGKSTRPPRSHAVVRAGTAETGDDSVQSLSTGTESIQARSVSDQFTARNRRSKIDLSVARSAVAADAERSGPSHRINNAAPVRSFVMELHTRQSLLNIHGIDIPAHRSKRRKFSGTGQLMRRLWQALRPGSERRRVVEESRRFQPRDPEHDHRDGRQATGHDDCGEA
jgi:hypothetical protein